MSFLAFLVIVAAITYLEYRHWMNARALLQDWAQANNFKILKKRYGMPLSWMFSKSEYQYVYRISVYDQSNQRIRDGWIKLGRGMWGVMDGDAIVVKWKDEPGEQH